MARKVKARKQFDRLILARIKREHGRSDVVKWLAAQMRSSESYVSQMLNNKTPRTNSQGVDFNTWRRLKDLLTAEEIELLEDMK